MNLVGKMKKRRMTMGKSFSIYKEVEVDVELDDFNDDDLLDELESRGVSTAGYGDGKDLLYSIWLKRRQGKDYQTELDQLIYNGLGKIL